MDNTISQSGLPANLKSMGLPNESFSFGKDNKIPIKEGPPESDRGSFNAETTEAGESGEVNRPDTSLASFEPAPEAQSFQTDYEAQLHEELVEQRKIASEQTKVASAMQSRADSADANLQKLIARQDETEAILRKQQEAEEQSSFLDQFEDGAMISKDELIAKQEEQRERDEINRASRELKSMQTQEEDRKSAQINYLQTRPEAEQVLQYINDHKVFQDGVVPQTDSFGAYEHGRAQMLQSQLAQANQRVKELEAQGHQVVPPQGPRRAIPRGSGSADSNLSPLRQALNKQRRSTGINPVA